MKEDIIIFLVAILSGFVSEIGGAGTLISLPVMISLGVPPIVANGTNRLSVVALYSAAYAEFKLRESKKLPNKTFLFAVPLVAGAIAGALTANYISNTLTNWIVIVVSVGAIFFTAFSKIPTHKPEKYIKSPILVWGLLFFTGIYTGLVQSGMTYLMFYILVRFIAVEKEDAKIMKFFFSMLVTPFIFIIFVVKGNIDWHLGALLFIGATIGGWIGASKIESWSDTIDKKSIFLTIITTVLLIVVFMIKYSPLGVHFL